MWDRTTPSWDLERWLAGAVAGACLVGGIRTRSWTGFMLTVGGGALAWWAAAEADERGRVRGHIRSMAIRSAIPGDLIGEASEESFPASDAPAWMPSTGNVVGHRSH